MVPPWRWHTYFRDRGQSICGRETCREIPQAKASLARNFSLVRYPHIPLCLDPAFAVSQLASSRGLSIAPPRPRMSACHSSAARTGPCWARRPPRVLGSSAVRADFEGHAMRREPGRRGAGRTWPSARRGRWRPLTPSNSIFASPCRSICATSCVRCSHYDLLQETIKRSRSRTTGASCSTRRLSSHPTSSTTTNRGPCALRRIGSSISRRLPRHSR